MKHLYKHLKVLSLMSLMVLMASCISNEKYMSAQNDIERLKQDSLKMIEAKIAAEKEAAALKAETELYESELMKKEAALQEKEVMLLEASQKALNTTMKLNTIANDLELFDSDFSQVIVEEGQVKVVMDQAILFDQGSTRINVQGDILLERLAATLRKVDDVEMAVEGHTDSVPVAGADDNWDLSVDRSIAVIERLTKKYGVAPEKLIAAGKSKFDPLVPNEDMESMAKNRRVEFIIIPDLDPIKSKIED
jgi:chemotaxis protein MotB